MTRSCRKAQLEDFPALQQMLELYQYELSDIWPQETDAHCRYGYDLSRHKEATRFHAHVVVESGAYAGFALVAPAAITLNDGFWMEQFFILKRFRRCGAGTALARHVFTSHPGAWEVGEMFENLAAQAFWRKVVAGIADDTVVEVQVSEGWWHGVVQQFKVTNAV